MIYLMRHGKDDERYVGGYSDVDLTREGQRQVLDSALWLKKNDVDVTRIYSSDVRRAVSSANIVSSILHKKVIIDSNLRELDKGILNGMLVKKALVDYPEYFNEVISGLDFLDTSDIRKREYDKLYRKYSRKYSGRELELKIKEKLYQKGLYYED